MSRIEWATKCGLFILCTSIFTNASAEPQKKTDAGIKATELMDAATVIEDLVVDLRYSTTNNFLHQAVYPKDARCWLLSDTAQRLKQAAEKLRQDGFRLKVWDCYRPHHVQFEMWKLFPKRGYVAEPKSGSHHNRGAAVDLTLVTLEGDAVEMPTDFDNFSRAAHHSYVKGTEVSRLHREKLKAAMEHAGFRKNAMEWWHWEIPHPGRHPLRDDPL